MRHLKDDLTASLIVMAVLGAVTALMLLLQAHQVVHSFDLVRDTNAIAGQPPWFGAISNLGILLWAVAAAWYWFAYALARPVGPPDLLRCLWLGGSYSAFACLDDLFMIHEHAGQLVLKSGEKVVLGLHAVWLVVFVASTLPRIRSYRWLFLGLSLAFFGGSTLVDLAGMNLAPEIDHRDVVLVEEVQKLAGIVLDLVRHDDQPCRGAGPSAPRDVAQRSGTTGQGYPGDIARPAGLQATILGFHHGKPHGYTSCRTHLLIVRSTPGA